MPSVHNPPTRFTVTYEYLHYMDMKPVEVLNTAQNRLEIFCTVPQWITVCHYVTFRNHAMIRDNRNYEVQSDTPLVSCRSELRLSSSVLRLQKGLLYQPHEPE